MAAENPSSLKLIDDYAFANCAALIEFEFPDSLEKVTETAFENCVSIKKLFRFSNFRKCKSLTKAKIHHKTEHISSYLHSIERFNNS